MNNRPGGNSMSRMVIPLLLLALPLWAVETIVLQPDGEDGLDTYVYRATPDDNYGNEAGMYVSSTTQCEDVTLLAFDLSALPAGGAVRSAWLELYLTTVNEPAPVLLELVSEPWDEETVTWNTRPAYDDTFQAAADPQADSWWDPVEVTDFVAAWYEGDQPNYGFAVYLEPTGSAGLIYAYSSQRTENQPRLTIEFSPQAVLPASWGRIKAVIPAP
ncbi:MAG: DNRLRE domain-containing protein [Candidatus Coatesbacteria bacterium]|nr:DNRLRE domain-containing protein [Candidatus Coatesbacteria bacterium]